MSTTTTNLGLTKPEGTEYPQIDILNDNADIIDQAVGELQDSVSHAITAYRETVQAGTAWCYRVGRIVYASVSFIDTQTTTYKMLFSGFPEPINTVLIAAAGDDASVSRLMKLDANGLLQWNSTPLTNKWVGASFSYVAAQ